MLEKSNRPRVLKLKCLSTAPCVWPILETVRSPIILPAEIVTGVAAPKVAALNISFLSAAAHKFHGPKGVGFVYINGDNIVKPYISYESL